MTNNDFPFVVVENDDGTFTFDWDDTHPVTSRMNDWTNDDFVEAIRLGLTEIELDMADRSARTDFTVVEFTDNWDELFGRVEDGETLTITHDDGQKVLIMPYDQLPKIDG